MSADGLLSVAMRRIEEQNEEIRDLKRKLAMKRKRYGSSHHCPSCNGKCGRSNAE